MVTHGILILLFSGSAIHNFLKVPTDWDNVAIASGIVLSVSLASWLLFLGRRREIGWIEWLHQHQDRIDDNLSHHPDAPNGQRGLCNDTRLREFKLATSFILLSTMQSTGLSPNLSWLRGIAATLWTLIFGWWALPWGPIITLRVLWYNLTGGLSVTVGEVLQRENEA